MLHILEPLDQTVLDDDDPGCKKVAVRHRSPSPEKLEGGKSGATVSGTNTEHGLAPAFSPPWVADQWTASSLSQPCVVLGPSLHRAVMEAARVGVCFALIHCFLKEMEPRVLVAGLGFFVVGLWGFF